VSSTYQISDKRGDAILVVKVEAPDDAPVGNVFARFVELASEAGIQAAIDGFDQPVPAAALAAAAPLTQAAAPSWGNPPVPPMQPAAAAPAGGPPVCQHGPKQYKTGTGAKGPWAFWGCTARSDDPTKCDKQWVSL
jgi:hypothetical protein